LEAGGNNETQKRASAIANSAGPKTATPRSEDNGTKHRRYDRLGVEESGYEIRSDNRPQTDKTAVA